MTGMIGHSARVHEYWLARDAGTAPAVAIRGLAESIREDTNAWLHVSAKEYSQAVPINFGAERIALINVAGASERKRAATIDAARRQRHDLLPLDPSNWQRISFTTAASCRSCPRSRSSTPSCVRSAREV